MGSYQLEVRPFYGANWFTDRGVRQKRKLIEKRGLPNMRYWKVFTLTVPEGVKPPEYCYEKGKTKLPRFLGKIRKHFGRKFPWAWKLEIQENGYPHWHVIVGIPEKFPEDFLDLFSEWWGLGRVHVGGIKKEDFDYLFKYASKSVDSQNSSGCELSLPDWVLDYQTKDKNGKPSMGIRFWQTGGGFYTNPVKQSKEVTPQKTSLCRYTIRQRWDQWMRKGTVLIRGRESIMRSKQILFPESYALLKQFLVNLLLMGKAEPSKGELSVKIRIKQLKEKLNPWLIKQIKPLLEFSSLKPMVSISLE